MLQSFTASRRDGVGKAGWLLFLSGELGMGACMNRAALLLTRSHCLTPLICLHGVVAAEHASTHSQYVLRVRYRTQYTDSGSVGSDITWL